MKTKIVNGCEVTMYAAAGPGRNLPARYVVRLHNDIIGTLEKYRGACPWQASTADGTNRGSYYGRSGLELAVASLRAAAAGL